MMGTASTERERIDDALTGLVAAFATDGYVLRTVDYADGRLSLAIDALEGACAECLVPESMMAGLIKNSLPEDLKVSRITIAYPEVKEH